MTEDLTGAIAIVGMSGRFPGAHDVDELWRNLLDGVEARTEFTDDELRAAGIPEELLRDPAYVKAGRVIDGIEDFDSAFFGIPPREAQILDPQQRLFLEESWSALERAGCDPARFDGAIGVFAGAALSTYLTHNIAQNPGIAATVNLVQVVLGNDKDSLATRVAHALDLRGPCFSIQSYCSTSLVAVCTAATSLLTGECDLALAGGVAISVPQRIGYFYQEGGMSSPDARCRTFDAEAEGTPIGNGVAVVALRRAEDAITDGDHIHAVIRGWAVNNDGALKVGFTAPGVRGQAGVVAEALASAGLRPAQIGYVEAHGTGTALGDAAEITALKQVFGDLPEGSCLLGSVKPNLGHLDRAAGVTGLIKAALCVEHGLVPPSLNFTTPNPSAGLAGSPFEVVTERRAWEEPRRAGVSAFGIGGTNAHVVLEQPPTPSPLGERAAVPEALVLSGRTDAAADAAAAQLADRLATDPPAALIDVAGSLARRRAFGKRRAVVASTLADATRALREGPILNGADDVPSRPAAFLLAGVGEHHVGMGAALHAGDPVFRAAFDECAALFEARLSIDLVETLYRGTAARSGGLAAMLGRVPEERQAPSPLARAIVAQPAVFAVGYATAQLLASVGVTPSAMLGYSVGEYVAACLSGVLDLTQAAGLVAERARLIDALAPGAMLAVGLADSRLREILPAGLDIAAVNGPAMAVVAGPDEAITEFQGVLAAAGHPSRRLVADRAFHSRMLAPIAAPLASWVRDNIAAKPPGVPYLSNVTGTWITAADVADPGYWARHACGTVRFADGLAALLENEDLALVEIGPGQSLGAMTRGLPECSRERWPRIVPTLAGQHDADTDETPFVTALATLWVHGVDVDWTAWRADRPRRRVLLPTYPFQRLRFWVDAPGESAPRPGPSLHTFDWQPEPVGAPSEILGPVLVFADARGAGQQLADRLRAEGHDVAVVSAAAELATTGDDWRIRPGEAADYVALAEALAAAGRIPRTVAHLWSLDASGAGDATLDEHLLWGFSSACHLVRAFSAIGTESLRIALVSDGLHAISPDEDGCPEQAGLLAIAKVAPQEHPDVHCRTIDVELRDADAVLQLAQELAWPKGAAQIAWRAGARLTPQLGSPSPSGAIAVREDGVYLITGGLGPVGVTLAEQLVTQSSACVLLTSRTDPPPRSAWGDGEGARAALLGRLAALDPAGDRVVVIAADAGSVEQTRAAVDSAVERFGRLDGVIHAAGLTAPSSFRTIEHLTAPDTLAHFAGKVTGALVLEKVLAGRALDFVVLQSSMSAVLGGLGFASYAAANSVLDAIALRHRAEATRWLSIDWDTWEATAAGLDDLVQGTSMAQYVLSGDEAWAAFEAALASGAPRVAVAAGDLPERMQRWLTSDVAAGDPAPRAERFARPALAEPYAEPASGLEREVADIWQDVLGLESVGANDGFMDLGGNSLMGLQLITRVKREFEVRLPAIALFEAPTVRLLSLRIAELRPGLAAAEPKPAAHETPAASVPAQAPAPASRPLPVSPADGREAIAVIGMSGRFPGADDPEALWELLRDGREAIARFSDAELEAAGVPDSVLNHANYVPARPVLDDVAGFDADFFGYTARQAALADPQQRLLIETAWEALESAGYPPGAEQSTVGVYVGAARSTYLLRFLDEPEIYESAEDFMSVVGNETDALSSTISYALDLTGPSVTVQNFCSTSLAAVHLAGRGLLAGECELAIAGGAAIATPDRVGHLAEPGGSASDDGRARPFDAEASGRMVGDGVGVVVLKRLSDARRDRDSVLAVLRGSAMNHDGARKASWAGASSIGQTAVVRAALADAALAPQDITYVEAHATGVPSGDVLETAALNDAFGPTEGAPWCAIGSIKGNVGHLEQAAGVTSFIKTVLALQHRELPATLHHRALHPDIDFEGSPFFVNDRLRPWTSEGPLRAGVSAFGLGGTNVHCVLEEAPPAPQTVPEHRLQLLPVSARTPEGASAAAARLADRLRRGDLDLSDVAATLQTRRRHFEHRRLVIASTVASAIEQLERGGDHHLVQAPIAFVVGAGPTVAAATLLAEPAASSALDVCIACGMADDGFLSQYVAAELLRAWGLQPAALLADREGRVLADCLADSALLAFAPARLAAASDGPEEDPLTTAERRGLHVVDLRTAASGLEGLLTALGDAWLAGAEVDWRAFCGEPRQAVAVPTYPFNRSRHWLESKRDPEPVGASDVISGGVT